MRNISVYNRIHIFGASGSGTTTIATELADILPHKHFDSDDYFWKEKFTEPWPRETRLSLLNYDLIKMKQWILSGAIIDWGNPIIPLFDLVIFTSVPNGIRIERLKQREIKRYGDRILPGNDKYDEFKKFIEWASSYESADVNVRSRLQQEKWIEELDKPVLRISGNKSIKEIVEIVIDYIENEKQS